MNEFFDLKISKPNITLGVTILFSIPYIKSAVITPAGVFLLWIQTKRKKIPTKFESIYLKIYILEYPLIYYFIDLVIIVYYLSTCC